MNWNTFEYCQYVKRKLKFVFNKKNIKTGQKTKTGIANIGSCSPVLECFKFLFLNLGTSRRNQLQGSWNFKENYVFMYFFFNKYWGFENCCHIMLMRFNEHYFHRKTVNNLWWLISIQRWMPAHIPYEYVLFPERLIFVFSFSCPFYWPSNLTGDYEQTTEQNQFVTDFSVVQVGRRKSSYPFASGIIERASITTWEEKIKAKSFVHRNCVGTPTIRPIWKWITFCMWPLSRKATL